MIYFLRSEDRKISFELSRSLSLGFLLSRFPPIGLSSASLPYITKDHSLPLPKNVPSLGNLRILSVSNFRADFSALFAARGNVSHPPLPCQALFILFPCSVKTSKSYKFKT
jgi:hypothetical protein